MATPKKHDARLMRTSTLTVRCLRIALTFPVRGHVTVEVTCLALIERISRRSWEHRPNLRVTCHGEWPRLASLLSNASRAFEKRPGCEVVCRFARGAAPNPTGLTVTRSLD